MGGWKAACLWETRLLDFKRKEFVELWVQSHGKADVLELGADAVRIAIAQSRGGLVHVGAVIPPHLTSALEAAKQ